MNQVCRKFCLLLLAPAVVALSGCENEPPPRSVNEMMENPILLEATIVRCAENRAESRYDPECVNAREAIKIIEVREESARRAELEAMSARKREALRRTQAAAAEARRRAEAERRQREEAEYMAQFGESPITPADRQVVTQSPGGNAPVAIIPEAPEPRQSQTITSPYDAPSSRNAPVSEAATERPASSASAPVAETPPPAEAAPPVEAREPETTDLEAIREELRRRSEDGS